MSRKSSITSALALTVLSFLGIPAVALAGSPLLSGYGGPGAGEQAILGSTLLNGSHGGGGSGGSSGSGRAGAPGRGSVLTPGSGSQANTGAGSTRGSEASGSAPGSKTGSTSSKGGGGSALSPQAQGSDGGRGSRASAYVYPSTTASSSVIGISGGDVLALIGIIATLTLIGVLTLRLVRLQPWR